jgi:hypothetical protein
MDSSYPTPKHGWVCFHCGEAFEGNLAGWHQARQHFGLSCESEPACIMRVPSGEASLVRKIRALENELSELKARIAAEDTDADRQFYRMSAEHQVALRREEEKGYERGLSDGRSLETANG